MYEKYNKRTQQMMQNFYKLHQEGYTIPEISELFNVTTRIIYYRLQEIADLSGTTREELLDSPKRSCHKNRTVKEKKVVSKTNIKETLRECNDILKKMSQLTKKLETIGG